ncbi:hypothetical protein [Mycolicibacterium setense]|uniref:hypothetical protein n=1 Tax=Mycolicibacterium setense TaxID=431269 RepID=UPI000A7D4543|nr:hypothetical protein [Mycolicibacterium setense]
MPYGQPGGHWQQPSWAPPPNKGGKGKWILVGLALVAVIAVSVVGTVLVLRSDTNGGKSPNNGDGTSEFASANDTGPANIITEDPTCEAWGKIARDMDAAVPEWNKLDYKVPGMDWTPEQRTVFENQSAALTTAIVKVANLARQTPHRVMRELYGQFNAYAQAVIDSIPNYSSTDNEIVATLNQLSSALNRVCEAIQYRAAQQSAPLIATPGDPSDIQRSGGDAERAPSRFMTGSDSSCKDWMSITEAFDKDTEAWRGIDSKISVTEWTPDQRAVMDAVGQVMGTYADDMEHLGRASGNPIWEDFAVLAAQYMRAYVQSIPTYTVNAGYLASVSSRLAYAINWACKAES